MLSSVESPENILVRYAAKHFPDDKENSSHASPSYDEAIAQLFKDLEAKFKEDPHVLSEALVKAYGNSEVEKAYITSLESLAKNVAQLDEGFKSVGEAVLSFDLEEFKGPKDTQLLKYKPKWDVLHDTYQKLMKDSRNTTRRVLTKIELYYVLILPMLEMPNDQVSAEEKIDNLNYFLTSGLDTENTLTKEQIKEGLRQDEEDAERLSDSFQELAHQVGQFRVRIKKAVDKAEQFMGQVTNDLLEKIEDLRTRLSISEKIRDGLSLGQAISARTCISLEGILNSTGFLAPVAMFFVVLDALGKLGCNITPTVNVFKGIVEMKNKITQAEEDLEALLPRNEVLGAISFQIKEAGATMESIGTKLVAISKIFLHVQTDAFAAREHLEQCLKGGRVPPRYKAKSIELATAAYEKIHIGLLAYAVGYEAKEKEAM